MVPASACAPFRRSDAVAAHAQTRRPFWRFSFIAHGSCSVLLRLVSTLRQVRSPARATASPPTRARNAAPPGETLAWQAVRLERNVPGQEPNVRQDARESRLRGYVLVSERSRDIGARPSTLALCGGGARRSRPEGYSGSAETSSQYHGIVPWRRLACRDRRRSGILLRHSAMRRAPMVRF